MTTAAPPGGKAALYADPANKPAMIRPDGNWMPKAMAEAPRWVCWMWEWRKQKEEQPTQTPGKWSKKPYPAKEGIDPVTGKQKWLPWKEPTGWGTYAEVLLRVKHAKQLGIGFVLGDGWAGIDLDNVRDPATDTLLPWASKLVNSANVFADVSPSGTGVKLIGLGTWDRPNKARHPDGGEVEVYGTGRYFTVTGLIAGDHLFDDMSDTLDQLAPLFPRPVTAVTAPRVNHSGGGVPSDLSDAELLAKMFASLRSGDRLRRLWGGDPSDANGNRSGADQSLCNSLAFWCNKDAARMDRMFRQSGLMRDKWDTVHRPADGATYGQMTIQRAIEGCTEGYSGSKKRTRRRVTTAVSTSKPLPSPDGQPATAVAGEDCLDELCTPDNARVREPHPESEDDQQPTNRRPEVTISTEEHLVNAQAAEALGRDEDLFQRAGALVAVGRTGEAEAAETLAVRRQPDSPVIRVLPESLVRERMTRAAKFVRLVVGKKKGEDGGDGEVSGVVDVIPSHPPAWCVKAVYQRDHWAGVRRLQAVLDHPVMLPDGRILTDDGYDPATGLLASLPSALTVTVPDNPTADDVGAAVVELRDVTCDFPFAEPAHFAAWVAGLLTPLAWFAFDGPAPLFLIDANIRAAGKGLLADVAALTLTGRKFPLMAYTHDEDELRKRITSVAVSGDRMVLFDNLTGKVGNGTLDAALTASVWRDRILGVNKTYNGPLHVTWFATANNCQIRGDLARRLCHVRLNSPYERPETRTDLKRGNLRDYVLARRGPLLSAALTLLRAYHMAGRPELVKPPMGSFEGWSSLVRQAVVHAGLADPVGTQGAMMQDADEDTQILRGLITGIEWLDMGGGVTVAEIIKRVEQDYEPSDELVALADAVAAICDGKPSSRLVAAKIKNLKERPNDGKCIDKGSLKKGIQRWVIRRVSGGGSGGSGGSVSVRAEIQPSAPVATGEGIQDL